MPSETPQAAVGDQLLGLGGLRDVERVAGQKFNKGILPVALGESGEALLELREGGFGGSDRAAAGQAAQGQRQSGGSGNGQNQDQSEAGGGHAAMRKGERVGDGDQHQRRHQSAAGEDGQAAQHRCSSADVVPVAQCMREVVRGDSWNLPRRGHFNI